MIYGAIEGILSVAGIQTRVQGPTEVFLSQGKLQEVLAPKNVSKHQR